jgi:5'-nucleotidase (lipoprotein e(P4) family)
MRFLSVLFFFNFMLLISSGCVKTPEQQTQLSENEKLLAATLFHQHAAEMRALSYQAYNLAEYRLQELVSRHQSTGEFAIVLDLDETVLDNSPYQAACILQNFNYPTGWAEWVNLAEAPALPGVVDFLNKAVEMGFQVFYISNRREMFREATKENFVREGIPLQSEANLILRTAESGKENRRQIVSSQYQIVMLIGDNLSDFNEGFDGHGSERRNAVADSLRNRFGVRYIVLPNTMYGDWLQALQNHDYSITDEQKQDLYYQLLEGFNYEKPVD